MKIISLAAALVIGTLSTFSANAMPMAQLATPESSATDVTKVDYACGRGWFLTRWGECRRIDYRRNAPPVRYWHRQPPPRSYWGGGWDRPRHDRDWRRYERH